MSVWMIVLVTACYVAVALDQALAGRPGMAIVFGGYAAANVGMIIEIMRPPA